MILTALWSPEQQFQHKNGAILTNGKIYVYLAGRTELAQIYVDDDGIHQSQNPVILDDNGRAVVFADEAYNYTAVVCDYYGQELFSFKPIGLGGPGSEAPKQVDIQSNSLNVEKSYNERTNTETFTLEVKNSDCKSWIGRDGQSSVIPADTVVSPLALPSTNEYDGEFIDRIENNNTIFLKEGLYHVDCVIEFTQAADSEQNKLGQIEVFTGLGNGDESTNLEINETGPLCDDEIRHCIKQTFIRKVKAGSDLASSELYFRPSSPVPLSSCKIKSLSIVDLSIAGKTDGANYYAGEHVEITENNVINVTGLQPSGNYANADSVTQGFYGVAQQINTLSGAIDDVSGSIPSLDGYATEQYVQSQVSGKADKSEIPSLDGYATQSWVQEQGYLTSVPSEYATDQEVQAAVSGKADKSEIPSLAGYATEQYVQSAVSGKQDELTFTYDSENKITSIDGHRIAGTGGGGGGGSEYIAGQYISIQNDIISVTGLQESGDYVEREEMSAYQPAGDYLTQDDLNGYATQEDVEAAVSGKADVSAIPSVAGLASESYVNEHIEEATSGKADVSAIPSLNGYATESWVNEQGFLKEVPQEYVTSGDLSAYATTEDVEAATSGKMDKSQSADFYPMASNPSGYLTEHQSLAGYATQEWVNQQNFVDDDDLEAATSGKMDSSAYTAPVNADWSATSGLAQILNKPNIQEYTAGDGIAINSGAISVNIGKNLAFESPKAWIELNADRSHTGSSSYGFALLGQLDATMVAALKAGQVNFKPNFNYTTSYSNLDHHFAICKKSAYNQPDHNNCLGSTPTLTLDGSTVLKADETYVVDFSSVDASSTASWTDIEADPTSYYLAAVCWYSNTGISSWVGYAYADNATGHPGQMGVPDPTGTKILYAIDQAGGGSSSVQHNTTLSGDGSQSSPLGVNVAALYTAGITDVQVVNSLPGTTRNTVLYLIPES